MRGRLDDHEQDGTYLFKGGQEHVGVAGHFHNCPGERRVVRAGLHHPRPPAPGFLFPAGMSPALSLQAGPCPLRTHRGLVLASPSSACSSLRPAPHPAPRQPLPAAHGWLCCCLTWHWEELRSPGTSLGRAGCLHPRLGPRSLQQGQGEASRTGRRRQAARGQRGADSLHRSTVGWTPAPREPGSATGGWGQHQQQETERSAPEPLGPKPGQQAESTSSAVSGPG